MGESADFFKVDVSKCVRCGACVRDCAFKALKADAANRPVVTHPERCMRCQHCLAICPVGAVSIDGKDPAAAVSTKGLELPSAQAVSNWMRTRRSIRRYADEDVDPKVLDEILTTLGNAQTGCNARGLTFTCFPNRASMQKLRETFIHTLENHRNGTKLLPRWFAAPAIKLREGKEDMFFRGATGMLVISSDETTPGVATPLEDVTIACSQFEMLAQAYGLGTCWCGFLKLVQLEVPELVENCVGIRRTTPFYAILFGKPAVSYARGVLRDTYAKIVYR